MHHIQGVMNECADYISCNYFDDKIGARSEELPKEAFSPMDIHLDLNMTMIRPPNGPQQVENPSGSPHPDSWDAQSKNKKWST